MAEYKMLLEITFDAKQWMTAEDYTEALKERIKRLKGVKQCVIQVLGNVVR